MKFKLLNYLFFFLISPTLLGQYTVVFEFKAKDKWIEKVESKNYNTQQKAKDAIEKVRLNHIANGHVLASIDSLVNINDVFVVYYYKGNAFGDIQINVSEKDAYLVKKIPSVREKYLRNVAFSPKAVSDVLAGINNYLINNGYPFSLVELRNVVVNDQHSSADLFIELGPEVKIQEIELRGETAINRRFLSNYIAIDKGDLYQEDKLQNISSRMNQVPFLEEIKPHELLFTPEGVDLYLYLKSKPVSLVNGVVGFQPNPVTGENVFTGDVRLKLQNVVKRGELLDVNWRSLQPATQDLKLRLNYPFLFNTPFGTDVRFNLYKRDSTFLTTQVDLGVQYFMPGGNYLKVFYEAENSNLLSGAASSQSLPNTNFASVSSNRYGIGLYRRVLDYIPNPSKGFELDIDLMAGRRENTLPDADSSNLATTFLGRLDLSFFIPLSKRHVLKLANRTRFYAAPEIFVNELNRFGGLTTQRGFDEEELFASSLTTLGLEYRFLVDRNSHAFAFFDQSFYENTSGDYYRDAPFGLGAGFSFGTNIGIFSISYAIGKQFDNQLLLRNGKVHFGYVSYF